ncbi:MAG: P-loop NTPase fold protein [Hellea sp.]
MAKRGVARMDVQKWLEEFIEAERLPQSYAAIAQDHFLPLADHLAKYLKQKPTIIGVNGAQGTGKTTFAKLLGGYWTKVCGLNGTQISLDDFYMTRAEREARAQNIHPLFATRGVPGTHDTDLALSTLRGLKALKTGDSLALPSFDKAIDNRKTKPDWTAANGSQDFIIFEGWCVGSRPVSEAALKTPINELEKKHDPKGQWRAAVNDYLAQDYQTVNALIDTLIVLNAPDFETVLAWRQEQEEKLALTAGPHRPHIMSPNQIENFIQYFERITRENLRILPQLADYVFGFDHGHRVIEGYRS